MKSQKNEGFEKGRFDNTLAVEAERLGKLRSDLIELRTQLDESLRQIDEVCAQLKDIRSKR